MKSLVEKLREPELEDVDVDGDQRLDVHRQVLSRKKMLREVFTEFHHLFLGLDEQFFTAAGSRIELGSGIAPIRDSYPEVEATDVVAASHLDRVLNAESMSLEDGSVRALYGQNCFHHFPHPDRFFDEASRVLAPGGGFILIEPYFGPVASYLFSRLFTTEGFDKDFPTWETPVEGPMKGANQALSYLVFKRDREEFHQRHQKLELVHQAPCRNYLKYLLSGGLNFRQLSPDWSIPVVNAAQWILTPLNRWLALHQVLVIRRKAL